MGVVGDEILRGIIPRTIEHLFAKISSESEAGNKFLIALSYLEIYNEKVFDLLGPRAGKPGRRIDLPIRLCKSGFHVPELSRHIVSDESKMLQLIAAGHRHRSVAASSQNSESSRSHAMFTVHLERVSRAGGAQTVVAAKLNMVDLAGSERYQGEGDAKMKKESASINQSLNCLGNVIAALTSEKKRKNRFIPYVF